ncbi:hypothetical protein [Streptomyces rhizosphaericus]|uniref:Uncharacterized protein n=1 Tax=Streptomyces rhizosphaericus TaxID=114699 RepID=A0A6G4A6R0_9ACTN|nr:hypothetical protein [Streptomyces rhizosphaericus]NEW68878.1 hypothetical protein [Streptomyces rhizosphaericus]
MTAASPVRRLRRAERTCWTVLIGPLCGAPLAVLVLLVVSLLPLVNEWRADSLSGREAEEAPHPVDWSAKGWVRVRETFHSAGLDTARLGAVSSWSPVADPKWTGVHPAPYARAVAAAWVFAVGVCLPAIGIWTGVLDGVSA